MPPSKFGFGQAVIRKEDDPLLRGGGRYVADLAPAGVLHAVVVRSPHAHARFRIADVATARAMPGVALILTGIAFGLLFTKYTVWWLASFMDDTAGYDALLFALISMVLFGIAAFSAYLPALRATRIDPVEALRHE